MTTVNSMDLTEAEIIYLEAHNIHHPFNAWLITQRAIKAKLKEKRAHKSGGLASNKSLLSKDFVRLAGICQKVVLNVQSRDKFKQLYSSCWNRGLFNHAMAMPARKDPYR